MSRSFALLGSLLALLVVGRGAEAQNAAPLLIATSGILGDWCDAYGVRMIYRVEPNGAASMERYDPRSGSRNRQTIIEFERIDAATFKLKIEPANKPPNKFIETIYRLNGQQLSALYTRTDNGTVIVENGRRTFGEKDDVVPLVRCSDSKQTSADPIYYVANTSPPDAFLALRTDPSSKSGTRMAALPNGTPLKVLQKGEGRWWQVRVLSSGQEGWVLSGTENRVWIECCKTTSIAAATPTTAQPSFDCSKAKTASARLICADADLSRLDGQLAIPFRRILSGRTGASRESFIAQQRDYIRVRNIVCNLVGKDTAPIAELLSSKECMAVSIKERTDSLQTLVSSYPAATEKQSRQGPGTNASEAQSSPQDLSIVAPSVGGYFKVQSASTGVVTEVYCWTQQFPDRIQLSIPYEEKFGQVFLNDVVLLNLLDGLRKFSLMECQNRLRSGFIKDDYSQPLTNVGHNFTVQSVWGNNLMLSANAGGINSDWQIENQVKKNEQQRQARVLAQQQAALEKQRVLDAKKATRTKFIGDFGVNDFVRQDAFAANPFLYKEKTVATAMKFVKMISESEAIFSWNDSIFLLSKVPSTRFAGPSDHIIALKALGMKPTTALGSSLTLPYGEFVGAYSCREFNCADFYDQIR